MNESTRNFLIFLFFIYIISTPTTNEERYPSYIDKEYILNQYHNEVNVSRSALFENEYSSGYGNVTGFKLSYEDSINSLNASNWPFHSTFYEDQKYSILPNEISMKASEIWNFEGKTVDNFNNSKIGTKLNDGVFPLNISGSLKGDFKMNDDIKMHKFKFFLPSYLNNLYEFRESQRLERTNPPEPDENDDIIPTPSGGDKPAQRTGNVTDSNGLVQLSILNEPNFFVNDTNIVSIDLKLSDEYQKNDHRLNLKGIYHQNSGNLIISTRSSKFESTYALPHLNLGLNDYFNRTKFTLINKLNETRIDDINFGSLEASVDASNQCEYIGYFHFESTNLTKSQWTDIDKELSFPLGRPLQKIPNLKINKGLLYSPDCGILLNINELNGSRNEIFYDSLKTFLLFSIILMICQLVIIVRQISFSNTPSSLSKLSFATVMIMNTFDSSICIISLICSMIYSDLYIQFAMLSFISFTCCALYEMKYAIQIYCVQLNERPLDWRTMLQGTPIDERISATNENQQTDPLIPIDNNEQTVGAELYSRNFFFLLILIFLSLNVITWPKTPRKIFEYVASFILNSYWIPQIYRNTLRGSRTSFSWEFIILSSIIRLVPFIYIESFSNPFDHHRDIPLVVILVSWMSFQIIVLYLQEEYGPRFFLNDKFLPQTYDYYPDITKSDLKSFHIDETVIGNDNIWVTDCAICMQKLDIPILENSQNETPDLELGNSNAESINKNHRISKRKNYMVTPCNHVFHTDCLENWMMYKLQCPNCRSSIPPY